MSLTKARVQQDRHLILGHHSFPLQHPRYKSSIREDVIYGPHLDALCNGGPSRVGSLFSGLYEMLFGQLSSWTSSRTSLPEVLTQ